MAGPEGYVSELFVAASARGQGVGTQLLEVAKTEAVEHGCSRLLVLNRRNRHSYERDFYQKRGWRLVAIHRDALEESRRLKPEIPRVGIDGIPVCDELELELLL